MPRAKKKIRAVKAWHKSHYGWMPDLPDHRDFLYNEIKPAPLVLPPHVDLREHCSPVETQGRLNSCTANVLAGALEFLEKKNDIPCVDLSRLFIYYNERVIRHSIRSDSGAHIRDGIKSLVRQGVCTETSWPYVISRFSEKPTAACYREASAHQITSYHRILSLDEMRACLAEGFPFVFGFTVHKSFHTERVAKTGKVNMPRRHDRALGGHAVMAVGYDDNEERFLVRNSWGTKWGRKGYFTMPYDYLADRNLSDDFWTIRRGEKI